MLDSYRDNDIQAHSNNKACNRNTEHFCRDHKKTLCSICLLVFHAKCNCDISNSKECIQDAINFMKRLFKSIIECSEEFKDSFNKDNFTLKIKYYNDLLSDINEKHTENKEVQESSKLKSKFNYILQFYESFINSTIFTENNKFIALNAATKEFCSEVSSSTFALFSCNQNQKENQEEIYEETKEFKAKLDGHREQNIKDKHKINKSFERELREKEQNLNSELFFAINEKILDSKELDTKNYSLILDLSNIRSRLYVREVASTRIQIPNIKRIRIDRIASTDKNLKKFMEHCFPDKLQLFCFNIYSVNAEGIKISYKT